jgi:hypothetical protein
MVKKIDPNPILVNINKLKLCGILDVTSQGLEATTEGGRKDLMTTHHQNLVLEYKSNNQHKINTIT